MIYKKTVVLSSMDSSLKKAVVTLDNKTTGVRGEVKLYNFVEEPMGILTLGLLVDGKVHKAGLTRVGYMHYQFVSFLKTIPTACTCAVVSSRGGNLEPLLIGSIQNSEPNFENVLLENLALAEKPSLEKTQKSLDTLPEFENQAEIEDEIEKEFKKCNEKKCENHCLNCEYKNAFYAETKPEPELPPKPLEKQPYEEEITTGKLRMPENSSMNFIDEIGSQLQGLFDKFPPEEALASIIPNSKWVKVDFNKDGKYYVVGLIYENDAVKYVCYGVPGVWAELPPQDFNAEAKFLPLDLDDPEGDGYWLTYQDAFDGELVEVNII